MIQKVEKPIVALHIDLKGVLFKKTYFSQLMEDLASQDINTILVEYEDIFPFEGLNITFNPDDKWSSDILNYFLKCAFNNKMEIIPLQQCLGHLEYLLRWQKYRKYAEYYNYPSVICLSNKDAKAIVKDMLIQVIEAHPSSRFIHLGMDEAHKVGTCDRCKKKGKVILLFIDYLRELIEICSAYGKIPIIWSDMLENYFELGLFDDLKDKVILAPWDYSPHSDIDYTVRLGGIRVSREWLNKPDNSFSPPISSSTLFLEDMPKRLSEFVEKYRKGNGFIPLFQARMWSDMGFKIIGATTVRSSSHLSIMPDYNAMASNIKAWTKVIRETNQLGLIATSWARGTTFCPPSFNHDLIWPNVSLLSKEMGKNPTNFWRGVSTKKVNKIITILSRCKKDWNIDESIISEMKKMRLNIKKHLYEWDSLTLMAEVSHFYKKVSFALLEVDFFHSNNRPVDTEWQRRIEEQKSLLRILNKLRSRVIKHFSKRYYGDAFNEWCRDLFDLWQCRLKECIRISMCKKSIAKKIYSRLR